MANFPEFHDVNNNVLNEVVIMLSLIIVSIFLVSCDGHDGDNFPYSMTGMDVWVFNNITEEQIYGGRIDGNYLSRKDALDKCGSFAYTAADLNHFRDWGYVCCTVTSKSSCQTKVR